MKRIHTLVVEHKRHIIGALLVSLAIFLALMLTNMLGVGGIKNSALQLGLGLAIAEAGRSLMCFGAKLQKTFMEYAGVFIQGIAWWIWSANFEFLGNTHGSAFYLHLLAPALLLGFLPVVVHHGGKHLMRLVGWESEPELTTTPKVSSKGAGHQS